jgi:hypothetical protein
MGNKATKVNHKRNIWMGGNKLYVKQFIQRNGEGEMGKGCSSEDAVTLYNPKVGFNQDLTHESSFTL